MQISISPQPVIALIAGSIDSPCPETIELYRCRLSHYIWHSRVGPLIGTRICYW